MKIIETILKYIMFVCYKIQWGIRNLLLPYWGQIAKQNGDLKGVTISSDQIVSYGKPYHRMYFMGRIF